MLILRYVIWISKFFRQIFSREKYGSQFGQPNVFFPQIFGAQKFCSEFSYRGQFGVYLPGFYTDIKCLVTEAQGCEQLAQSH